MSRTVFCPESDAWSDFPGPQFLNSADIEPSINFGCIWDSWLVLSGYELSKQGLLSTRFALAQLQGRLKNGDALTISSQALKSVERAGSGRFLSSGDFGLAAGKGLGRYRWTTSLKIRV